MPVQALQSEETLAHMTLAALRHPHHPVDAFERTMPNARFAGDGCQRPLRARCQSHLKRSDSLQREYGRACRWSAWGIGMLCFRQGDLRRALPQLARALAKPRQLFAGFLYQTCLDLQHETRCPYSASTYG